jgi:outer membrane protein OmpA-like peptidoglycan-associated protein
MKKLFIPIILLIGLGINVFAQEKTNQELKGDKFFFNYSFDRSIVFYNRADPLSFEGQRRLAESYHNMGLDVESEAVYLKLITDNMGVLPEDYYNYAMVLKANGKYTEAAKSMDKFKTLKPNDLRAKDYVENKNEFAALQKDNGIYKIEHLNINTDALDFGTSYYKNSIVFSSTRTNHKMIVRNYNWTNQPFWDIYMAEVDGDQLKEVEIFDKDLNSKLHDGPVSFSNEGNFIAFTRNTEHDKTKDKVVELQICFSNFVDGKWTDPEPFFLNNEKYSVGHPCLSIDGRTMYFASDMPGGYGGVDIYRISRDASDVWGKAENLGIEINTEGDEMFPFYEEKNGKLFFASNGHSGLGGLDIFECTAIGIGFGPVNNAGFPLNTQYNDFAFIVNNELNKGYFSSDRADGSGGDDIYSVGIKVQPEPAVLFTVNSPENIAVERRVRETFPLRNYVFFNIGSTEIPERYVLLSKDQVKEFKEDQLALNAAKEVKGRSKRQLVVYYNVLNILGDRLQKNPASSIKLVGSSELGPDDGLKMSESVKTYLTSVFGINASRISTEGRDKPKLPSEQPGGILELELLREGDRRVSVESSSPALLMEFQSGPDAPLKPVEFMAVQEAPLDSYVTFNAKGSDEAFTSWSMEITDNKGEVQNFGPYTQETVSIPGRSILGIRPVGDFKVTMTGQTKRNMTVKKDTTVHMVLWNLPKNEEGLRFSIIYEFNDSKAIAMYDKYLTEIVIPKIPANATVIIHGYTDIIGEVEYNLTLSKARANDVKAIMEKGLMKAGRSDVKFEVYGFGEDENLSQFDNKFPEERFYNRTVVIDIIPKK